MSSVDRLAELRMQIRQLQIEERDIRHRLIAGFDKPVGDHYIAKIRRQVLLVPVPEEIELRREDVTLPKWSAI